MSTSRPFKRIKRDTFAKMSRLRYLHLYCSIDAPAMQVMHKMKNKMQLSSDGLHSFPKELRYLEWCEFPMKSLPSKFSPENLVVLKLPNSKIKKLWTGTQVLLFIFYN